MSGPKKSGRSQGFLLNYESSGIWEFDFACPIAREIAGIDTFPTLPLETRTAATVSGRTMETYFIKQILAVGANRALHLPLQYSVPEFNLSDLFTHLDDHSLPAPPNSMF